MSKKILVVAAHPDDEVLGCGGTIAKHKKNGDEVHVLILAEGITSREEKRSRNVCKTELSKLAIDSQKANNILGVDSLILHDYPDNRMDSINILDIVKLVEGYIDQYRPDVIYTHYGTDLNIDHQITNQAVITACRPVPGHPVKKILFFEVPSSTEWQISGQTFFTPNYFMDISTTLEIKLQALEAYVSEMRNWPHSRSIKAVESLAQWRGASIGREAAEAFVLGRYIDSEVL